jgi:NADP-reducing hydrogenase subunit HndD
MSTFYLNGKLVKFQPGQTILDAAKVRGVHIPTLCHLPQAEATGTCGICVVEQEGGRDLLKACSTPVAEGMRIMTDTPRVTESRRATLKRLVASGDHNCFVMSLPPDQWDETQLRVMQKPWHDRLCPAHGNCRLQDLVVAYGVDAAGIEPAQIDHPLDDSHPVIIRDFSRCIHCGRCAKACNQVQVNLAIDMPADITEEEIQNWHPLVDYEKCTHCGECIQACPVGALFEKKAFGLANGHEAEKVRTTCPYCGVGCQLWLHVKDNRIVKVTGVEDGRPNLGRLCVKGRFGYDFIHSPERLTTPLIKENGEFREASWDEALDLVAKRFSEIKEKHGPNALAGVSCARSINEDSYQMQKFFRAVIGTNNIDHCART